MVLEKEEGGEGVRNKYREMVWGYGSHKRKYGRERFTRASDKI